MTTHPVRFLSVLFATVALAAVAFASPAPSSVTTSLDATYVSQLVEKGARTGSATVLANLRSSYESFDFTVTAFIPTTASLSDFRSVLSRTDLTGGYRFFSTFGDASVGTAFKHYNHPGKTGQGDQFEPFARLETKGPLPLYITSRYNVATRNVNLEGGAQTSLSDILGFKVTPAVYAGYNDTKDSFPHSLKVVKAENRYYGGGVTFSRTLLGGNLSVGAALNRADASFANTTFVYSAGYGFQF